LRKTPIFSPKIVKIAENCDHNIDPTLGEFSPFGLLFSLGSFSKKWLGHILGDFEKKRQVTLFLRTWKTFPSGAKHQTNEFWKNADSKVADLTLKDSSAK
jgi:hypothetical protein